MLIVDRILSNNNQALNESNILPSETHCSESINSIDVSINSNNSSKSYGLLLYIYAINVFI